jgi:hypothetical protein
VGHFFFFLAAVAASLLWSAAFTAAAARCRPGWIRRILVAAAVVVPVLSLVPWVGLTAILAFGVRLEANWFAPTLTAAISSLVGAVWIVWMGLSPRVVPVAAAWPVVALAAGFVLAKAVAFGTLLFIDNAVAAEGRMLRVEAAQMMAAALPPAPGPDDDAAPLYQRAFAALAADKTLAAAESPCTIPLTADVATNEVSALLERHAATLDLLRRAADRPGCRFERDWSRPSLDMLLPELQEMRQAARLLALAARRAAAAGNGAQALADVVRIHRLGRHAASEPLLINGLVGQAIDEIAIGAFADVLPRLGNADRALLEAEAVRDFVETPITYRRGFLGEEAFGLGTLADLADGAEGITTLESLRSFSGEPPMRLLFDAPLSLLYRCFMLPADIAGYRAVMRRYQAVVGSMTAPEREPFSAVQRETAAIENELESRRAGVFATMLAPSLAGVFGSQVRGEALHDVAGVLVAATRARLAGASLAESLVPEAVPALPPDRFAPDQSLRATRSDEGWLVYTVGPDGEDDGGPPVPGAGTPEGNDDCGLRLAFPATSD